MHQQPQRRRLEGSTPQRRQGPRATYQATPAPAKQGPPRAAQGARTDRKTATSHKARTRAASARQGTRPRYTPAATYNATSGHGNGHGGQGLHQVQPRPPHGRHTGHQPQPRKRGRRRKPCQYSRRKRTTPHKGRTNPEQEEASRRRARSERLERLAPNK